jgi:uncharacterized lipoprotein YajG
MRTTLLALALLASGCSTTPTTKVPTPAAARDGKTPVVLEPPSVSHRIMDQRFQDAQVAQGKLAVEGQLVR